MISDCLPLVCTGLADSAGNVTVSHPVTSVNGMTGEVTISSVGTATTCPNIMLSTQGTTFYGGSAKNGTITLPSGGTWAYSYQYYGTTGGGKKSGGSTITPNVNNTVQFIAIRIA